MEKGKEPPPKNNNWGIEEKLTVEQMGKVSDIDPHTQCYNVKGTKHVSFLFKNYFFSVLW